jgi:hypothetical protein
MLSRKLRKRNSKKKEKFDLADNNWKQKHFELLCRIDDLCRQNDIDMYLADDTALMAYQSEELSDYVSVCIDVRDAKKFIKAVDKAEGLLSRGMYNYYRYPRFDIKVYDPETIDFNVDFFEAFGFASLFVIIKFINHIPDKGKHVESAVRNRKAYRDYIEIKYDHLWRRPHRRLLYYQALGKVMPPRRMAKFMFSELIREFSVRSDTIEISMKRYKKKLFDKTIEVKIYDRPFRIPADVNEYLGKRFGAEWRNVTPKQYKEGEYTFRDGERSWDEYKKRIDYIDLDKYYGNYKGFFAEDEKNHENLAEIDRTTKIIIRTHLRFLFWQKYYPLKTEIVELHEKKDYRQLEDKLRKYIAVLEKFAKSDMTVCFDEDIFDITVDTLRHTGRGELADKIVPLVPEEHKKPVRIKDYRGEYIQ